MTFAPGDAVSVRLAWPPGHVRAPAYIRGRSGRIEQVLGTFPNPEELAYRRSGKPAPMLYRVRFQQRDLWPEYAGRANDTLDVEIYEHWLVPVDIHT